MKILLLTLYFEPDVAANAVIMTELVKELVKLGHEVTVVTSMPHYDNNRIWPEYRGKLYIQETFEGLEVRRVYLYVSQRKENLLGRLLNYVTFNILSFIAGIFSKGYDVVLSPSPPLTNGLAAFLISRLRGKPYVYNVQDIYPDVAIRLGVLTNSTVIAFFKWMERFVYKKAAAVSVLSEGFRRNLLDKGVPEDKIEIIPNFVDTDFVHPLPRHNAFSKTHKLDDKFVVLFAGNMGFSQGLELVLDAAQRLEKKGDILFLFVGSGVAKPGLQDYAQKMGIENVDFLPFQPREVLPEMYASSDVCLVPLRRGIANDSVPSKLLTITAAARPLIASVDEESDARYFVQQAECGLCTDPENSEALVNAIFSLYHDSDLRERLGQNGRAYLENRYTPKIIARQYATLLKRVVE